MKVWIAHEKGRGLLGELPAGAVVEVCPDARSLPSDPADVEFWVPPFLAGPDVAALLSKLGAVRVIQLLSAGAEVWIGRATAHVTLCDGRGVHDRPMAEWVVGAAVAMMREFPAFARAQERGEWAYARLTPTRELTGARVLIVGAGSIGAEIERHLAPFDVTITRVARTARPDQGVHGVEDLPRLLPDADVVVLIVPITEQTRGMVDAAFLAAMPDGAVLINGARGPVVDTAALLTEVTSGRISAALDVTDPEPLPPDHPLWRLPNVFITPHVGGTVRGMLPRGYALAGDQLRRYAAGEELINQVSGDY